MDKLYIVRFDNNPEQPGKADRTFPAGTYYIGDLAYIMDYERRNLYESIPGMNTVSFWTRHGDGLFTDNEGFEYGVDSATIGITPYHGEETWSGHTRIVEFDEPFTCESIDRGATLRFGHVVIDTEDEYDEEDC